MESYISFSIISVFFYTFMILTLLAGKRSRIINSFMCVLGGMLCWTLGSFLMRMEAGPSYILWYYVSLAGILFLPYFYYVFISEFMGVRMGRKSKIPLLLMLLLFAINIPGGIILRWPDLIRKNGGAHFVYKITPWFLLFFVVAGITIIQIFITMYRGCRRHPGYRKQIEPILVGILIIFVGNLALAVPVFSGFPIDIVSGLINAVLMLYALTRRRLFQMRRLASDGVCFGVGVVLTVVLFINLSPYLMSYIRMLLPAASEYHVLIFSFVFLISAWLVTVLWKCLMNNVFIKKEIQQSQELKDFSQSVSRTLRVGEILRNTVNVLKETTNAGRIYICLRDKKSGEYQAVYSNRPLNDLTFSLKADNPVVTWLTRNEDCVVIRDFRSSTAYKSMWESEKHMFSELGIEYCAGLRQNDDLAGIIAISGDGHRNLNHNDLAMLSSVSSVASIAIKNARLYEAAWTEARTDELTGLLNRKYFYEILDEEYEKNKEGSLALILFNIDDFKLYNQLYGNQQGDVALRKVADIIQASVGEQGYVARHSAKEFAVLMPNYDIFSNSNILGNNSLIHLYALTNGRIAHDNGITDHAAFSDHNIWSDHRIMYFPVNFCTLTDQTSVCNRICRNILRRDNISLCVNLPEFFIEIKFRNNIDQFHIGLPIRTQCSYILPVSIVFVGEKSFTFLLAVWKNMFAKITAVLILQRHQCFL